MTRIVVETPAGQAWVDLTPVRGARQLLVIGHGAGGSVDAPDLLAVSAACRAAGIGVALVTQPYRVAGRKAPPAAATLDLAWTSVLAALRRRRTLAGQQWYFGGRSSGARVACRAAADPTVAPRPAGVVALAFPVHPPGRPDVLRTPELDAVDVPVLVVQGARDPFGCPAATPGRQVSVVPGDHSLKQSAAAVGELVAGWLSGQPAATPAS